MRAVAVTTDFSEASKKSFGVAADLARRFSAPLYLLHVVESPEIYTAWQIPASLPAARVSTEALEGRLKTLAFEDAAFRAAGGAVPRLLSGEPAEAVSRFQEDYGVDLLVVGTHGYSDLREFHIGSFAAKMIRLVSCPVLVFRTSTQSTAETYSFHLRHILAPHDFSPTSRLALDTARRWAEAFGASVRVQFIVEEPDVVPGTPEVLKVHRERVRADVSEHLERLVEEGWGRIPTKTVVTEGYPAREILTEARDYGVDLIVLGSRGHTVLPKHFLGSVAERVVQGASCPVLVVKPAPRGTSRFAESHEQTEEEVSRV